MHERDLTEMAKPDLRLREDRTSQPHHHSYATRQSPSLKYTKCKLSRNGLLIIRIFTTCTLNIYAEFVRYNDEPTIVAKVTSSKLV